MPTSSPLGKDIIQSWFANNRDIHSIVDVGPGNGTYRRLLGASYHWIGIEVWSIYVTRFKLHALYDEILVHDITTVALPNADCIIFGDIIEHLSKYDGMQILERANIKYHHLVLSIPIGEYKQGEIEGNPYERHESTWAFSEIVELLQPMVAILVPYCDTCPLDVGIGVFCK